MHAWVCLHRPKDLCCCIRCQPVVHEAKYGCTPRSFSTSCSVTLIRARDGRSKVATPLRPAPHLPWYRQWSSSSVSQLRSVSTCLTPKRRLTTDVVGGVADASGAKISPITDWRRCGAGPDPVLPPAPVLVGAPAVIGNAPVNEDRLPGALPPTMEARRPGRWGSSWTLNAAGFSASTTKALSVGSSRVVQHGRW